MDTIRFRVGVKNPNGTAGIGETIIEAVTEEDAKSIFAAVEGATVEALAANGLTDWSVIEA